MALTSKISLYDDQWPGAFSAEKGRIAKGFGCELIAVHHVGSTAVPGLAAKPDPEPLLATLVQLNCPVQEALFVGDSGVDALCAKYAGVDFVVHSGGYHSDLEELQPAVLRYERASQLQQWLQGRINAGTVEN
mgnify:CR=1 FL=1